MIYYIENEQLKIGVKDDGCELTSVYLKNKDKEYLWQGSPEFWSGQSPILFPIAGRLYDDKYSLDGKEYTLEKHGFARKMKWEFIEKKDNSLSFLLRETEDTLKKYPYTFELRVDFAIEENRLSVSHTITNTNNNVMYASLGAHPAFNCKVGDRLVFSENETLATEKIDYDRSLRIPETQLILDNERVITLTEKLFEDDALIFHGVKSEYITLEGDSDGSKVIFDLGGAPYLLLWAKPGAPYVCIEPWCGVNDSTDKKSDFSLKDGINKIDAGERFIYCWKAEFI